MKNNSQNGFSLIELLIVVVILGIIASLAVPYLYRAQVAAENRAAVAFLSTIRSAQTSHYAQSGRYGKLDELQKSQNGSLGDGNDPVEIHRGRFTFTLASADEGELRNNYNITATRDNGTPIPVTYTLDQSGVIVGINE